MSQCKRCSIKPYCNMCVGSLSLGKNAEQPFGEKTEGPFIEPCKSYKPKGIWRILSIIIN